MEALSQAAGLAQTSLKNDPDRNNPYAIFLGPTNEERMSASEIEHGLCELDVLTRHVMNATERRPVAD
jgi:hypothetical protein